MIKTLKAILFATVALLTYIAGFSQQVGKSIPNSTSPDGIIGFLEFRPPDYGTQKHPLIIFLHGAGEVGNGSSQLPVVAYNALPNTLAQGNANMRFVVNGVASSFVVISPQLSPSFGYWPSFYVSEMIKYAKANLSIDPNRIYVTGLSLGGGGVWRLISDAATLDPSFDMNLAAAAPICATGEESDANFCRTVGANHLPVWAFHCMDDTRVSVTVTQHVEQVSKNCGVSPAGKFTYYATGDHSGAWISAYDFGHITKKLADGTNYTFNQNLYEWFLTNSRSNTTPPPTNTPPSVSIGPAQIITLPTSTATLTGSGAGTNGATISTYTWAQTSGPTQATIVSTGSTVTQVTGLVQGTYTFSFTVKDSNGLTATASVTITVNAVVANTPPLTTVTLPLQTITMPLNAVTVSGAGVGTNGATISTYAWSQTGGPNQATIVAAGSTTTVITGLIQGTYVFTLTVKDNHGLSSSATATVIVNSASSTPPVVGAGSAQTITLPVSAVSLTGTATASSGASITSYSWIQTSGPNTASISAPASTTTTVSGLAQGTYVFSFTARDNNGLTSSATVTVTVRPASTGSTTPVSDAGAAQTVTGNTATLNGSASYDPNGTIVQYYWMQLTGPSTAAITDNFGGTTTARNLVNGVYSFLLQVKDNSGLLAYSTTTVTVSTTTTPPPPPPGTNQAPVSRAGTAQTVTGSTAILNGTASSDPDGTIAEFYWSQISGPSQAVISNNFSATPSISGLVKGVYSMQLQVKDNGGALNWSTTTVTVNAAGARIADAGTGVTGSTAADLKVLNETVSISGKSMRMYPNPAINSATIILNSDDADIRKIAVYNTAGVLVAGYRWPTIKGSNTYLLKNIGGFGKGLYIIQVTDSKGKINGMLKFVKL